MNVAILPYNPIIYNKTWLWKRVKVWLLTAADYYYYFTDNYFKNVVKLIFLDCGITTFMPFKDLSTSSTSVHRFLYNQIDFKGALCPIPWLIRQTELKGQHSFMLFYFVYMWWTLPPFFKLFWRPYFRLTTKKKSVQKIWVRINTSFILISVLNLNFFSCTT